MSKKNQNWTVVNMVKTDFIQTTAIEEKRPQYRTGLNSEYGWASGGL